ncbi:chemotaxis protein CheB [Falsiroseomonas sp. E2-1-a20]|uniref:chemotaxis protein CheB n=1 Tax=Falsiroseomonas sp. E2-1-a20 TaxID=3239300 RepID=UPI003F33DC15
MEEEPPPFIVAIGASGDEGLNDIKALLASFPHPINAIVMVVLHRPSERISALRDVLARRAGIPVVVAEQAETFEKGVCYIGEPDQHLTLGSRTSVVLVDGSDNRLRNRTIDTLFISLAKHAGRRTIGVILSGSLDDGSRGIAAIHEAGGLTMVLDPKHKPRGMQQNAIDYDGPISVIGTAKRIGGIIGHLVSEPGFSLRHTRKND